MGVGAGVLAAELPELAGWGAGTVRLLSSSGAIGAGAGVL